MPFLFKNTKKPGSASDTTEEEFYLAPSYSEEIKRLKERVSCAYDNLDNVVDPLLIDSWIYEINAAQLRYQFCLQQLKEKTGVV